MDEVALYNRERWKALTEADALFSRPRLDMDLESARKQADPHGMLGDLLGARVLCLGGGGGRQSAAFAILGADVTVADLSPEQLERDRRTALHYGVHVRTVETDMRDLSGFDPNSFDIVDQPYSINFVPDCRDVFREAARVLRAGGHYRVAVANPFGMSVRQGDWNGMGYLVRKPYVDGQKITSEDQDWVYDRASGRDIPKPVEYRQNLGRVVNGLIDQGFRILHFSDSFDMHPDVGSEPGTWDHYVAFLPPWFSFLTRLEN